MKNQYNILVTGCGGDIGQSIGKILKSSTVAKRLIGCDLNLNHAGKFIFDEVHILPACRDPYYLDQLQQVIEKEKVDIVIPIAEAELRFFNERNIYGQLFGKTLITANKLAMDIGLDKLATANFLKVNNMPYPQTGIVAEISDPILPVVIKSRDGSGSKNLFIVKDLVEFSFYAGKFPNFIAQELVGNENVEYTCGLFMSKEMEFREISFRRKLMGGFSGFGEYSENEEIHSLLENIARKINLQGSINVQLRLTEKGPCVFEINPRFSSTVMFRHLMGFQDVIWSIENSLNIELSPYNREKKFTKFYKGFNEYVD